MKLPLITHFFSRRFLSPKLSVFLSEFYDYSVYQADATADFAGFDGHLFSFFGDSWAWKKYKLNGVDITDPFFSGRQLYAFDLTHHDLILSAHKGSLSFYTVPANFFSGNFLTSYAGGEIPYYKGIRQIHNHMASQLRDPPPPLDRRQQPFGIILEGAYTDILGERNADTTTSEDIGGVASLKNRLEQGEFADTSLQDNSNLEDDLSIEKSVKSSLSFYSEVKQRKHMQFDEEGYQNQFDENMARLSFVYLGWNDNPNSLISKTMSWGAYLSGIYREHQYADFYYDEDETSKRLGFANTSFVNSPIFGDTSLTLSYNRLAPNNISTPYNVFRVTGEGINPFQPDMHHIDVRLIYNHDFVYDVFRNRFVIANYGEEAGKARGFDANHYSLVALENAEPIFHSNLKNDDGSIINEKSELKGSNRIDDGNDFVSLNNNVSNVEAKNGSDETNRSREQISRFVSLSEQNQHQFLMRFGVSAENTVHAGLAETKQWKKDVFFRTSFDDDNRYSSLYTSSFYSEDFWYWLFDNSLGFSLNYILPLRKSERFEKSTIHHFRTWASAGLDFLGVGVDAGDSKIAREEFTLAKKNGHGTNDIFRVAPSFSMGIEYLHQKIVSLSLSLGRENIAYTSEWGLFLARDYLYSQNYIWRDQNNNRENDGGNEQSDTLHSTSGSAFHSLDQNFKQPHYYYLYFPLNFHLPKNVVLGMSMKYRIYKNQPWVTYDGALEKYGSTRVIDGEEYFVENDGTKRYLLTNLPTSKFPDANFFNDSPIFVGATVKLAWHSLKAFFSFSFTAYLVNSASWYGNGPIHNSLGVIEETMAYPEGKGIGRNDTDRSYLGRILFSYQFHPVFLASFSLTYRDGQPFGIWSYVVDEDSSEGSHVAWLRKKVNGDNILLYGGEFGNREDAIWNMDLRFLFLIPIASDKPPLELRLTAYNLLDLALEVLEYISYDRPTENRAALESQHPRAIEISLGYYF